MDAKASKLLFLLLAIPFFCLSGLSLSSLKDSMHRNLKTTANQQTLYSYRRELIQHDFMNPPITTFPTTPVTNPVTTPNPATVVAPPDTSTSPLATFPPANPITATPILPPTNPINPPIPVTNPVTTPSTTIPNNPTTAAPVPPVTVLPPTDPISPPIPVTNPVTTPSTTIPGGSPGVAPPVTGNAPAVPGQSWCVARGGLSDTALQVALDYACGIGGADCSTIQQGASCYNPNSLQSHASYAFNSYYQRNPVQTSCDFGGTAMITNVNPSSGSCVFTSASSSASPTMASPLTTPIPTPTTDSSSGAMPTSSGSSPNVFGAGNPALGGSITGYGENPPTASISSASTLGSLQPFIGCVIVVMVIQIITRRTVLGI